MLLNKLQCTGQLPLTRKYQEKDVNSFKVQQTAFELNSWQDEWGMNYIQSWIRSPPTDSVLKSQI